MDDKDLIEENFISTGEKRKLDEKVIKENEKNPKISKFDDAKFNVVNDSVERTNISKSKEMNSTPINDSINENTESKVDISKQDELESTRSDYNLPAWEFYNVLRSERPLNSMGIYTKYELHGIVQENVVAAFRREKNQRLRQMKRESKKTKDPSNIDKRLVILSFSNHKILPLQPNTVNALSFDRNSIFIE